MPRIRTLKPEHRQHRKVGPLSDFTYRLWVGMILEADDEGRLVADPFSLRSQVFSYRHKTRLSAISSALLALSDAGLARLYVVDGVQYVWFPSWHDHQRIDKPQPSRLPAHPDSTNGPRTFPERSTNVPRGSEGSKEGKGSSTPDPPPARPVGAAASLEIFRLQQQQAERIRRLQREGN
jgi:hypothetical protein